ncbi:MAG: DUF3450 family protein [Verrucomicrobiota bacterium]
MLQKKSKLITFFFCSSILSSVNASEALDSARNLVKEWVATEKAISSEAAQWQEKKDLLNDLLSVTEAEVATLEKSIRTIEESATVADASRTKLVNEQEALAEGRQRISKFLSEIEPQLLELRAALPEPLSKKLANAYQRIPKDPSEGTLGVAERMQSVVSILSIINKFDRTVTVYEEIRALEDGTMSEVETVYLGLGAAYYRTRSGKDAGFGQPGPDGWSWQSEPSLGAKIAEVIAIANNQTQLARFIDLPVKIQN